MRHFLSFGLSLVGASGIVLFTTGCATTDEVADGVHEDFAGEIADEADSDEESIGSAQQEISAQCAEDLVLCGFSATGTLAACAADVWAGGTLTPACAAAFTATGGACAAAAGACAGGSTLDTRKLALVGSTPAAAPDYSVTKTCPSHHRVYKEKVEWFFINEATGNGRVSRITMTCTDGTNLVFGHGGGTYSNTYTCSAGRLMNGELIKAGQEIDAAGGVCQKVASNDPTTYVNGIWGANGGTRQDKVCPLGEYMTGATMHMDGPNESNANLRGMEIRCR